MDEAQRHGDESGAGADVQQRFVAAYTSYMQALQNVWMRPDLQQRGTDAYGKYLQVLQEAWPEEQQNRVAEAYRAYLQVLQEALAAEDTRQHVAEAYRAYVREVRDAWVQVDDSALDTNSLAAIGQSMLAAAWMASAGTAGPADTFGTQGPSSLL